MSCDDAIKILYQKAPFAIDLKNNINYYYTYIIRIFIFILLNANEILSKMI